MKLLGQRDSHKLGFTLLETTIVLGILGTSLLIMIYKFPSHQQQVTNEKMFWEQLNITWKQNVYLASSQQEARSVVFHDKRDVPQRVEFMRKPRNGENPNNVVPTRIYLPKTMEITQLPKFYNRKGNAIRIETTGHPTLATVKILSKLTGETTTITTQMGWGTYHVSRSTK